MGSAARIGALFFAVLLVAAGSVWAATINGTSRNDTLRGSPAGDRLYGKGGNDKLFGAGGNDTLVGGPGNDVLVGGPGKDMLRCGPGRDTATRDVRDQVPADCEVVRGPKPVPPAPPPAPPQPPPPPPPVVPPQATYEFGTGVSSRLQEIVRTALGFAGGYFRARLSREIPPLGVYVYTDLEEIRAAWIRVQGGSAEEARRLWPATEIQASAPPSKIFLYVRGGVGDDVNLSKIVVHEAFHNLQRSLLGGRNLGDPALTPIWLVEGSAEYIAYRTIAEYGSGHTRQHPRSRGSSASKSVLPRFVRSRPTRGSRPGNSPYPLSALAADRLQKGRRNASHRLLRNDRARRCMARGVPGRVLAGASRRFYTEFEAYRSGL